MVLPLMSVSPAFHESLYDSWFQIDDVFAVVEGAVGVLVVGTLDVADGTGEEGIVGAGVGTGVEFGVGTGGLTQLSSKIKLITRIGNTIFDFTSKLP
jgi:hypothetical protein